MQQRRPSRDVRRPATRISPALTGGCRTTDPVRAVSPASRDASYDMRACRISLRLSPPRAAVSGGRRLRPLTAIVLFRSGVFVFSERAHFDSDQAITGLMAKHLAEGRAFPVFWYGQSYMLAVESWLAAPLFMIAGASVTALKLPLLFVNIAIALLLWRGFARDVGLRPMTAIVPTLFFALPAAGNRGTFCRSQRRQRRAVSLRPAHLDVPHAAMGMRRRLRIRFPASRVHAVRPARAARHRGVRWRDSSASPARAAGVYGSRVRRPSG